MTLYPENPKDTTSKSLELITEFSRDAGYKIYTYKSFAFFYTTNTKSERTIKETFLFTIATKRINS